MYTQALYVFLLAFPLLSLVNAQHLLRVEPPVPTAAPLFIRQGFTCGAGMTSCTDGGGGCCDVGAPCGFDNGVPICEEGCGLGPTCTGVLDGLCCQLGYTCNYQSTIC